MVDGRRPSAGAAAAAAGDTARKLMAVGPAQLPSLERVVEPIPAFDSWEKAIAEQDQSTDKGFYMAAVLQVLAEYQVPSAAIAIQAGTDPRSIAYEMPEFGTWDAWGYGVDYKAPMRVASVSKPITYAVWMNNPILRTRINNPFMSMWRTNVSFTIPSQVRDTRVYRITVKHLLDHVSGITNDAIDLAFPGPPGGDPAFRGRPVDAVINRIMQGIRLSGTPGEAEYSYNNFGYMVAARLAQGLTGRPWLQLVRSMFPPLAPVFAASDTVPVTANARGVGNPGAAEPDLYYVNPNIDGEFDIRFMAGNGNLVTNVATLTWFGTQYWMVGPYNGISFRRRAIPVEDDWQTGMAGSVPGSIAVLSQDILNGRAAAFAVIVNTRPEGWETMVDKLFETSRDYLRNAVPA
ncbi:hypothetical protein OEZ86_010452 [Tetradesmus obliquus]|nr:hypothetical protein OEZ86_010452 [Tetradesmus obliquus]